MKPRLKILKPAIGTIPGRLQMAATTATKRLKGRAAVDRRARFLRANPLCEICKRAGRVSAATAADHRIPLWAGGADDLDTNGNSLCDPPPRRQDSLRSCHANSRSLAGDPVHLRTTYALTEG